MALPIASVLAPTYTRTLHPADINAKDDNSSYPEFVNDGASIDLVNDMGIRALLRSGKHCAEIVMERHPHGWCIHVVPEEKGDVSVLVWIHDNGTTTCQKDSYGGGVELLEASAAVPGFTQE